MRVKLVVWVVSFVIFFGVREAFVEGKENEDKDYVVATLGEDKIYFSEITRMADDLSQNLKDSFENNLQWRYDFIQNYVTLYALAQRAQEQNLDKNSDVVFTFENVKRQILSNKLMKDTLATVNLTEENLENYFEGTKSNYQSQEELR
ncbi:MAG: SurA N-terminal domain-containing protein, partial [Candidatus Omnitrophota bacterium]